MDLIRLSLDRPTAVIAAVLMILLFGFVALQLIPIQLIPDLRKPIITITTQWPGAAPAEVEREIIIQQEEKLKGLEGLEKMISKSKNGIGEITLEFRINRNMDQALLLVANRLDRIESYPEEVDKPSLQTSSAEDSPIAWFILSRLPGNTTPIASYGNFVEDFIQDRLERVPGVSRSNVFGGSERELQIVVNPEKMARYGLTVPEITDKLRRENASISAGDINEGKRRYVVRTEGELVTIPRIRSIVLRTQTDLISQRLGRVTIGDIGDVTFSHRKPVAYIRHMGKPAIAINAIREKGANVIETMEQIRAVVTKLQQDVLPTQRLTLTQVYDETVYINSAINLVTQNIYIGGVFAIIILMLFLRSAMATLIIALAIPVSVIGAFVAMAAMGRTINVVSLAGIAFAIGMVVDAAIVVLENIFRLRQSGMNARDAAYHGAKQVWGAIFVSALTTVLVFTPILIMDLEIGQLFRDIAVAISVAVLLSLLVAITLIPALANWLLKEIPDANSRRIPPLDRFARRFVTVFVKAARRVLNRKGRALAVISGICGIALTTTFLLLPKLEYLPEGNRNLIFGIMLPPPGYNLETMIKIAARIEEQMKPLWSHSLWDGATSEASKTVASPKTPSTAEKFGDVPKIRDFFFVAMPSQTFLAAISDEPSRVRELMPVLQRPMLQEPGTFGLVTQPSLFGRGISGGRSINLDISGADLDQILAVANQATGLIMQALPMSEGNQFRPIPGLEQGAPEVRLYPDPVRLADNGLTTRDLGMTIDAFNDGLRVAEVTIEGRRVDLMLKGPEDIVLQTQGIRNLPVVTASGMILPASSLANIEITTGPTEIRHLERDRTVTLEIRPTPHLPLEAALDVLQTDVIDKLQAQGIPKGIKLGLSGTADKLTQTWEAMSWNLLLAVAIVYLVMAVLFESFIYPLLIIFSVPLATAGGVLGLAFLNLFTYQALDMLTLLGFVILIGIVVNNAILLVHQTLHHQRQEGMRARHAILRATQNRIRPIFMSTLTSVFGMLPLVLFPGAGSELYRGLGSVVVGGLALSAVLTLAIIPPLLALAARDEKPTASA
ncbi:efflux RND transporter permease subunit [Rhodospirillaceae bacterium AH-315-P19]|nr:efflux RND transporter permease subunit [Rhodospirillaceae bacterium AH-315-P19]